MKFGLLTLLPLGLFSLVGICRRGRKEGEEGRREDGEGRKGGVREKGRRRRERREE